MKIIVKRGLSSFIFSSVLLILLFAALLTILLLISLLLTINLISAQVSESGVSEVPGVSEIPGTGATKFLGEIDSGTGLPKKFSEYKEFADELRYSEQNKSYLTKEWTKILANNKFFGPFLFYTDKFFSFFNFFWKAVFKMEFSWSWAFFFSFLFWIILIIIIYYPLHGILRNNFIGLMVSVIIASLIGIAGAISKVVIFLTTIITNVFALIATIFLLALLVTLYIIIMKKSIKQTEETELEMAKEKIKALGRVSEKGFEED